MNTNAPHLPLSPSCTLSDMVDDVNTKAIPVKSRVCGVEQECQNTNWCRDGRS